MSLYSEETEESTVGQQTSEEKESILEPNIASYWKNKRTNYETHLENIERNKELNLFQSAGEMVGNTAAFLNKRPEEYLYNVQAEASPNVSFVAPNQADELFNRLSRNTTTQVDLAMKSGRPELIGDILAADINAAMQIGSQQAAVEVDTINREASINSQINSQNAVLALQADTINAQQFNRMHELDSELSTELLSNINASFGEGVKAITDTEKTRLEVQDEINYADARIETIEAREEPGGALGDDVVDLTEGQSVRYTGAEGSFNVFATNDAGQVIMKDAEGNFISANRDEVSPSTLKTTDIDSLTFLSNLGKDAIDSDTYRSFYEDRNSAYSQDKKKGVDCSDGVCKAIGATNATSDNIYEDMEGTVVYSSEKGQAIDIDALEEGDVMFFDTGDHDFEKIDGKPRSTTGIDHTAMVAVDKTTNEKYLIENTSAGGKGRAGKVSRMDSDRYAWLAKQKYWVKRKS